MVDLVREVLLPLLGEEAEAGAADDAVDHLKVAADAAVHIVQDHALLGHVVFDDDDAVGAQALLAAPQELGQVLVGQVAWKAGAWGRDGAGTRAPGCSSATAHSTLHFTIDTQGQLPSTVRGVTEAHFVKEETGAKSPSHRQPWNVQLGFHSDQWLQALPDTSLHMPPTLLGLDQGGVPSSSFPPLELQTGFLGPQDTGPDAVGPTGWCCLPGRVADCWHRT